MAAVIGALRAELAASIQKWSADLEKARGPVRKMRDDFTRLRSPLDVAGRALQGFARHVFSIRGAIASVAGSAGLGLLIKNAIGAADSIAKAADIAGFGIERFQSLRYAADQVGIGAAGFDDAMRRLNRRMGEFVNSGGGPAQKAFERLGIAQDITTGKIRTGEQAFDAVVRAMAQVSDTAQRSALAAQLFGDDFGPKLVLLLNQGVDGIEQLERKARDMGLVLREGAVRNAEAAGDALSTLGDVIKTNLQSAILEVMPQLTELANRLSAAAAGVAAWIGRTFPSQESRLRAELEAINAEIAEWQARNERARAAISDALGRGRETLTEQELAELRQLTDMLAASIERVTALEQRRAEIEAQLGESAKAAGAEIAARTETEQERLERLDKALGATRKSMMDFQRTMRAPREPGLAAHVGELGTQLQRVDPLVATVTEKIKALVRAVETPQEAFGRRSRELSALIAAAQAQGTPLSADQIVRAQKMIHDETVGAAEATRRFADAYRDLGSVGADALTELASRTRTATETLRELGNEILRILVRIGISGPIQGTISGLVEGLFAPSSPPLRPVGNPISEFQHGGMVNRTGLALVHAGEGVFTPEHMRAADRLLGTAMTGGGEVEVNVIDQRGAGAPPAQVSERRGPGGRRMIDVLILDTVRTAMGAGMLDGSMATNYGVRRVAAAR